MDWFWVGVLMIYMYFMGSFITWYLIKRVDHDDSVD
jgi:hypothetical protein